MPIYEFYCEKCNKKYDKLLFHSELNNTQYCECDNTTPLQQTDTIHTTTFNLKGKWYKTTKSY